jgi:hypothetical protein
MNRRNMIWSVIAGLPALLGAAFAVHQVSSGTTGGPLPSGCCEPDCCPPGCCADSAAAKDCCEPDRCPPGCCTTTKA